MTKKLFSLITLLLLLCSSAWATKSPADNPATSTRNSQKFLDVANTETNATIKTGSVNTLAYSIGYIKQALDPSWYSGGKSNSSHNYSNAADEGFIASSSNGGVNGNGYYTIKSSQTAIIYATGFTELGVMGSDNASDKYIVVEVEEYDESGNTSNKVSFSPSTPGNSITTYSKNGFSGSKYYRITFTSNANSNCKLYQVRFTPYTCTTVAAPSPFTRSSEGKNSLTYTWTKATNAVGYIARLYSDSECSSLVSSQVLGDVATVTFSGLSSGSTYYCQVQSKGNGDAYCAEGNVTAAVSGTTTSSSYTITTGTPSNGTIEVSSSTADENDEINLTANPNTGYEFVAWVVTKDDDKSDVTSSVVEGNTLTMPAYSVTVTATFAIVNYTITHSSASNGTYTISVAGGVATDENTTATYGQTITLAASPSSGYSLASWNVYKSGDMSTTVEIENNQFSMPAYNITIAPSFVKYYSVTYDGNGADSGDAPTDAAGYAEGSSVTVADNIGTLAKSGYSIVGWNTDSDATTASQAFGSTFEMGDEDVTLYAIWQENYYEFTPKVVASDETIAQNAFVSTSNGGTMKNTQSDNGEYLKYTTNGLYFSSSSKCQITVTLNDYMKVGTVITATFWSNTASNNRGVDILNAAGTDKGDWYFTGTAEGVYRTFAYKVVAEDGFEGEKSFTLKRKNNAYLKSLTVTNCKPGVVIGEKGWATFSNAREVQLPAGVTVYYAEPYDASHVKLKEITNRIVPAETGVVINGDAGTYYGTITSTNASLDDNLMKPNVDASTLLATTIINAETYYNYTLAYDATNECPVFKHSSGEGTLAAGKAYLQTKINVTGGGSAPALHLVFNQEENATSVSTVQESNDVVKFFRNGNLYIVREGITYDALGRVIR